MAEAILLYAYWSAQIHDTLAPPAPSWMAQEIWPKGSTFLCHVPLSLPAASWVAQEIWP